MKKLLTCPALICLMVIISGCANSSYDRGISEEKLIRLQPRALRIIETSLTSTDGMLRVNAVETVSSTKRTDLMPKVVRLLEDNAPAVRFASAVAIGDTTYTPARSRIIRHFKDEDINVRIASAYAMAKFGDERAADYIRGHVLDNDQTVRANALLLLGKLGNPGDRDIMYTALRRTDSNDKVKLQAMESIARLGDNSIYERLWALLISKHPDDRVMGIRAMGKLGTQDAESAIITMLDDDLWEVRLCAADELGKLGSNLGEPEVIEYIEKASKTSQKTAMANGMAVMAIGNIPSDSLKAYLPKLLNSKSKLARLLAAKSLLQTLET